MSSGDFRIVQTTNDREIIASFQRQQQEIIKLLGKFSELKAKGGETANAMGGALSTAVAGFGRLVGTLTGIGSVISGILAAAAQVRREYENIISRQERHNQERKTYEEALGGLAFNFAGYLDRGELDSQTRAMAQKAGVTPEVAANAMSASVSVAAPKSRQEVLDMFESVEAGLSFSPAMDPETRENFSTAITQLRKVVEKETGQKVSGQEAAGFVIAMAGMAPAKDLGTVSEDATPAVLDLVKKGYTPQQAAALTTTMASESGDVQMQRSANAVSALADQLGEHFAERFPDLSAMERLKMVADDEHLRKAFIRGGKISEADEKALPEMSIDRKNKQASRDIMTPGTAAYESVFTGIREMKDFTANAELYKRMQADIKAIVPVTSTGAKLGAQTSQLATADIRGAITAELRNQQEEFLQTIGETDLANRLAGLSFDLAGGGLSERGNPFEYIAAGLEDRAKELEGPSQTANDGTFEVGGKIYKAKPGVATSPPPKVDASGAAVFDVFGWGERRQTGVDQPKANVLRERAAQIRQEGDALLKSNPELFKSTETTAPAVSAPVGQPAARETTAIERSTAVETEGQIVNLPPRPAPAPDRPQAAAESEFTPVVSAIFALIDRLDRTPQTMPQPVPNVNVNVATNDRPADRNFSPRTIRPTRSAGLDRRIS